MDAQETSRTSGPTTQELLHLPQVEAFILTDNGVFPNNRRLPLLVYKRALNPEVPDVTTQVQALLAEHGWGGSWIDSIFDYHHYHSNAHEVLAVCGGRAEVRFGGEHGITLTLAAGDVVVIPAGVAHKNLGAGSDFVVVGAYPRGQEGYDMCHGRHEERPEADKNIVSVPDPESDPLYGTDGLLKEHWRA
ncbi:MAG: cupin domain-containing protein [Planctomycetes bacterium]|nr:cupin domain-containing protein [Planctomycetota bacterium]